MGFDTFATESPPRTIEAEVQITLDEAFQGTMRMLDVGEGKRLEANIPRGVATGSKIRMRGAANGADIVLTVQVLPDSRFERDGDNLRTKVTPDLYSAVLGGEVQVQAPDKTVALKIPAGTQNGKTFRLRGLGMPSLKDPDQRGDLLAVVDVQTAGPSERERAGALRGAAQPARKSLIPRKAGQRRESRPSVVSPSSIIGRTILVMDPKALQFLKDLLATPSPSGYEQPAQEIVRQYARTFADQVTTDVHGNVIAGKNVGAPLRVMFAGHCDQIGLVITHIDDKGFLYFLPIGGWDPAAADRPADDHLDQGRARSPP